MRTTTHNGRGKGGKAYGSKHNDRNFDVEQANNIIPELSARNEYWSIIEGETFEAGELKFYEENFSEQLQATNDKYVANRHPERCKTMAEWKMIKQNAPEETILQIGRMFDDVGNVINDSVTPQQLLAVYKDFKEFEAQWNAEHGRPFTLLNEALHVDEPDSPPHIQRRKVWHYRDVNGCLHLGQERALELAGVELPNPSRRQSRYNNRKITYDKMMREKWLDICEAHGIEVERVPLPGRGKTRDLEQHIRKKFERVEAQTKEYEKLLSLRGELKPRMGLYKASDVDKAFARHLAYPELEKRFTEALKHGEAVTESRDELYSIIDELDAQNKFLETEIERLRPSVKDLITRSEVDSLKKQLAAATAKNRQYEKALGIDTDFSIKK